MAKEGRPLKFKSLKELQLKVDDYFEQTPKEEWTITGLAIHLDTFRSVLCDYEEKDEFSNTIKKAKQRVENGYEVDLKKHGRSGTIFALKNFNWKDKTETDLTTNGKDLILDSDVKSKIDDSIAIYINGNKKDTGEEQS